MFADNLLPENYTKVNCAVAFDQDKTFLTFFGDSLGDFVNENFFGYLSWETYLFLQKPQIDWNVQNFAVAGWTTANVYQLIQDCSLSDVRRSNFKTSDNYVFEIGGNDYKANSLAFAIFPWKGQDFVQHTINNTELIIRAMRHPKRNKRVLLMGNFPTLAKSPSLGDVKEYFANYKVTPSESVIANAREVEDKRKNGDMDDDEIYGDFFTTLVNVFRASLNTTIYYLATAIDSLGLTNIRGEPKFENWYQSWIYDNFKNPVSHAMSILMFMAQPQQEAMAARLNAELGEVHYLLLYPYFIRHSDCFNLGHCYVANPYLFEDLIHVNYLGYFLWSIHLAQKLESLGWHLDTTSQHTVTLEPGDCPSCGDPETDPSDVVVTPPNPNFWLDLLIAYCLWTNACGK